MYNKKPVTKAYVYRPDTTYLSTALWMNERILLLLVMGQAFVRHFAM